jgi:hypothetical protein
MSGLQLNADYHGHHYLAASNTEEIPFDDANRVYTDEHDLSAYGCGITPLTRTSVKVYDHPQRRWYELNIDLPVPLREHEE